MPSVMMDKRFFPNGSWENISTAPSISSSSSFTGLDLLFDLKPLFIPLYAMLVIVACCGNLLLLLLIVFNKKLHSTTNFLIGNLALADLVMCLFCVPLTAAYAFDLRGWVFGRLMCHFVTLMQVATVFVAVLSLTAIAVDRYVVVAYPIRRRLGRRFCWSLVVGIWVCALALSVPTGLHTGYLDLSEAGHHMAICEEFWQGQERGRLIYSCAVLLLSYFVPLAAVSVSYCAISHHLRRRSMPGAVAASSREKWGRKKRKTFQLLLVSVLCFAFSWLPLQVVNLIRDLDPDFSILGKNHINVIQVSCHLLAMSSACYNPFIYASLHDKFRSYLGRHLFPPRRLRQGRSSFTPSHRIQRLHTSSTLADFPMVVEKLPLEARSSFN
ncbi:prolactin releasing hormone 2 receptor [Brienomyrus brachyistius]|uniref:prolactin releasing hormone 2 receptor n=1 Tax=Brienomyrus brachyistius TaxID=42636 RepID=UPI0020B1C529|nr:prolactin releasing hormone 2 receptor [Brienomyrus brachyistius]XP_048831671.1 prolactin releasing hormone 2 receptor [Brienomyrus brachyistius]